MGDVGGVRGCCRCTWVLLARGCCRGVGVAGSRGCCWQVAAVGAWVLHADGSGRSRVPTQETEAVRFLSQRIKSLEPLETLLVTPLRFTVPNRKGNATDAPQSHGGTGRRGKSITLKKKKMWHRETPRASPQRLLLGHLFQHT